MLLAGNPNKITDNIINSYFIIKHKQNNKLSRIINFNYKIYPDLSLSTPIEIVANLNDSIEPINLNNIFSDITNNYELNFRYITWRKTSCWYNLRK